LEKLYAYAVGRLNECDANGRTEIHGVEREQDSLFSEIVTKTIEISTHMEAKVVRAPMQALFPVRLLTRSLATDNDGGALEGDKNLRGATNFIANDDFAAQLVHVPGCSGLRVLTDEVDMVKNDAGITHNGFLPPSKQCWTLRPSVTAVSAITRLWLILFK